MIQLFASLFQWSLSTRLTRSWLSFFSSSFEQNFIIVQVQHWTAMILSLWREVSYRDASVNCSVWEGGICWDCWCQILRHSCEEKFVSPWGPSNNLRPQADTLICLFTSCTSLSRYTIKRISTITKHKTFTVCYARDTHPASASHLLVFSAPIKTD